MEKTNEWVEELHVLSETAKIEPQAVYTCILSGYKHKFNFYIATSWTERITSKPKR